MSGHLLHFNVDPFGFHSFTLECVHPVGEFPSVDPDTGEQLSTDCWVESWNDELTFDEYAHGDWPEPITFPCPVVCRYEDGMIVEYAGPLPGGVG